MLTSRDDIVGRLKEWYDPEYYDSMYRQMKYAFGEPWDANYQSAGVSGGRFPHWPDINVKNLLVAQSRRILTSQFIGLSKVMYNDPEPEYPSLDAMTAESRKQFLLNRWRQTNWSQEEQCAFMEGDGFGIGFLQIGLIKGPKGKQMITARHSPTLLTLGDRNERNPSRWKGICFVHYVPAAEAKKRWGSQIDGYVQKQFDGQQSQPIEAVRIFEYLDMGYAGGSATRALIPGDFDNEPLDRSDNTCQCLPFSSYIHFLAPGMRRPTGRVVLQMAIQEGFNEIEDYMRSVMVGGKGFDVATVEHYEPQDIKAVRNGDDIRLVRRKQPQDVTGPWERVPPAQLSADVFNRIEYLERRFNEASGVTDFDTGNLSSTQRTLGENQLVDQRGQVQGSWSVRQMIAFREQTFTVAAKMAGMFDRDETTIEYFGGQVPVNVEQFPESTAEAFCSQEARPVISEESMTYQDQKVKNELRRRQLMELLPLVQMGMYNPRWWAEEVLKTIGEKDTRKAIMIPETNGMGQDPMAMIQGLMGGQGENPNMGPGGPTQLQQRIA